MLRIFGNFKNVCHLCQKTLKDTKVINRHCYLDQFDPPYLEQMKPDIPEYSAVNVQIKGYDFSVLESFQSFVDHIAKVMEIDVEDGWATPCAVTNIKKFKPNSSNVECEYILKTYERNVQIVDVPSTKIAIFTQVVQAALPQGVSLSIHEHQPEHEEIRYVPDYELKELEHQLETGTYKAPKK